MSNVQTTQTADLEDVGEADVALQPKRRKFSSGVRMNRQSLPWGILTVIVVVAVLLPIVPLQLRAFADSGRGLREAAALDGASEMFWTTLKLGLGALVVAMVVGVALALSMHAMSPRLKRFLSFMPIIPMVIPAVAHVVGFVFLFSPENGYINSLLRATPLFDGTSGPINVYQPIWIIVYTGVNLSAFVYLFVYTGLRNLGHDYGMAAQVNGASGIRTLFTVTLPLLRPTLVYAGVVCFLLALGQFTGPLILGRREGLDVITTRMFELTMQYPVNYEMVAALGTPLILIALVLVVFQRKVIGNQNRFVGTVSATQPKRPSLLVNAVSAAVILAFTLFSAVLPIVAIVIVAFSRFWSGAPSMESFTTSNFQMVLNDGAFTNSVSTTLVSSISAVIIVIPLGMLIALAIYNRDRLWGPIPTILDIAANLPLTLPAALMGFGFLFAFSHAPIGLYGSIEGLIAAYVILMIPYSVRYQLATLVQLGRQTTEASSVAGATPMRTFLLVVMPLAKAGIASSAIIMFILLIHEFGVSLLLRAPDVSVMSVVLFEMYDGGGYPQVAVIALLMTAITTVGVVLGMVFGGSRAFEKM